MKCINMVPALIAVLLLAACKKEGGPPAAEIPLTLIELHNQEVRPGEYLHLDLDSNGKKDFTFTQSEFFSVIEQAYKLEFHINSYRSSFVLAPMDEFLPALPQGETIRNRGGRNRVWCNSSQLNLVRKTTVAGTNNVSWEGTWMHESHKFIPIKITSDGDKFFLGWIDVSMDIETETITVHRAALSRVPEASVVTGGL